MNRHLHIKKSKKKEIFWTFRNILTMLRRGSLWRYFCRYILWQLTLIRRFVIKREFLHLTSNRSYCTRITTVGLNKEKLFDSDVKVSHIYIVSRVSKDTSKILFKKKGETTSSSETKKGDVNNEKPKCCGVADVLFLYFSSSILPFPPHPPFFFINRKLIIS